MTDEPEEDNLVRLASTPNLVEFDAWQRALKEGNIKFRAQRVRGYSMKSPNGFGEIWLLGSNIARAKSVLRKLVPPGKSADLYFGW